MTGLSTAVSVFSGVRLLMAGVLVGAACSAMVLASQPRKAYLLVQVEVTDQEQYQQYAKLSPGIIAKHGGRYLARSGRTATLEGPPAASRVVVIEFPSFEQAQAFYASAEYSSARKLRDGAGRGQFVVVEGVE